MPISSLRLWARHTRSEAEASLTLQEGQCWVVGHQDGGLAGTWNIPFDPGLSPQHFRIVVVHNGVTVESAQNQLPIIFQGGLRSSFTLAAGQKFVTSQTRFELEEHAAEPKFDPSLEVLSVTAMLAILLQAGVSYGRIFHTLQEYHSGWMQETLERLEDAVLRQGQPLSTSMSQFPEVFSDVYVAMVELGESTDLGRSFERLYRQLILEFHQKRRGDPVAASALSAACLTAADVLDGGGSPARALSLASRTCGHEPTRQALLALEGQLTQELNLAECDYPPELHPLFRPIVSAHDLVGSAPRAFRELADLVKAPA